MVKKIQKKLAFSLVESLISMLIITIVALASLPVLTKSRPQIEATTIRGQYACWIENDEMLEWYFDERSPRTEHPVKVDPNVGCKLKLDQRPANFYILATGAGGFYLPAQVSTQYSATISNELTIDIGRISYEQKKKVAHDSGSSLPDEEEIDPDKEIITLTTKDRTTNVFYGESSLVADGAQEDLLYDNTDKKILGDSETILNGLIPSNIKSCKLISGPDCALACRIIETTSVNYDSSINKVVHKVAIDGCNWQDEEGNHVYPIIDIEALEINNGPNSIIFNGRTGDLDFRSVSGDDATELSKKNNFSYKKEKVFTIDKEEDYEFNFELHNSSYMSPYNLLWYENNISAFPIMTTASDVKSKMTQLIESITVRRQTELTKRLIELNPGGINRNGAVLILW